jgi:uncharacterized protein (TIGR02145 family)
VKIGSQIWMAENLNYDAPGSKCYDNDPANGDKYGRLYDWNTAKRSCPPGWHLPTDEEFSQLLGFIDGTGSCSSSSDTAGLHLKATSGWDNNCNGKDTYGFAALPSGIVDYKGQFVGIGNFCSWWADRDSGLIISDGDWTDVDGCSGSRLLYSVRCVKD